MHKNKTNQQTKPNQKTATHHPKNPVNNEELFFC